MNISQKTIYVTEDGIEHPTLGAAQQHVAAYAVIAALHRDLAGICDLLQHEDVGIIARWILERYELRPDREVP
jgi:hypothetical protein